MKEPHQSEKPEPVLADFDNLTESRFRGNVLEIQKLMNEQLLGVLEELKVIHDGLHVISEQLNDLKGMLDR